LVLVIFSGAFPGSDLLIQMFVFVFSLEISLRMGDPLHLSAPR